MFEELFEGPIACARQCQSPFPEERRRFLSHLKGLGYARSSLKAVACELIVIAARLDLSGSASLDAGVVEAAARRWATHQIRRHHSTDAALSTRNFRHWARQWLRYLGRWKEAPPVAASSFRPLLDGFTTWMADEQGLAPASIRSHGWKTGTFLTWYGRLERPFADVAIQDVDDFSAAKEHATWSRRSVAIAAQALRAFFRYTECRQQCRPGIAAMIAGPRHYNSAAGRFARHESRIRTVVRKLYEALCRRVPRRPF
jgi:integrase/recombinase XerD